MSNNTTKILKNWYVNFSSIKTTKGTYQDYLLSQKRHPGQDIKVISNSDNLISIRAKEFVYREKYQQTQRARKVSNGREVVISLPNTITNNFTNTDWTNLYKFVMYEVYKEVLTDNHKKLLVDCEVKSLNSSQIEELSKILTDQIYAVKHKNDHLHLIVPTIYFQNTTNHKMNFVFSRYLSKKKYSQLAKDKLNDWLKINKNIDKNGYMVDLLTKEEQIQRNQEKDTIELYNEKFKELNHQQNETKELIANLQTEKIDIENTKNELNSTIAILISKINELKKLGTINKDSLEQIDKQISTAQKQINNSNTKRAAKTIDRITKTITPNFR
ncbi:MAG: hypothetical protein U9N59_06195 [Campylobacterota bacterium]|nr:hypothetical protein [Campylobacterota bacterium]